MLSTVPVKDDSGRLLDVGEVTAMLSLSKAWVRQHRNGMRRCMRRGQQNTVRGL